MPDATDRSAVFPPEMTADRQRFLALLREKSYERRKVVLSSGRESDFYIDCKQSTLDAEGRPHGAAHLRDARAGGASGGVGDHPRGGSDRDRRLPDQRPARLAGSGVHHPQGAKKHGTEQWIEGRGIFAPGCAWRSWRTW